MIRHLICGALVAITEASMTGQTPDTVALSLTRQYGRALYRDCRLDVTIIQGQGRTALQCSFNIEPPKNLRAERTLAAHEVTAFSALVRTSGLCNAGHTGRDGRAGDGVLETLMTNCPEGRVAVLVTSGNPTFSENDARRQLLDRIHALEDELRKSAPSPK
jgi:hypothetical protein